MGRPKKAYGMSLQVLYTIYIRIIYIILWIICIYTHALRPYYLYSWILRGGCFQGIFLFRKPWNAGLMFLGNQVPDLSTTPMNPYSSPPSPSFILTKLGCRSTDPNNKILLGTLSYAKHPAGDESRALKCPWLRHFAEIIQGCRCWFGPHFLFKNGRRLWEYTPYQNRACRCLCPHR